MINVSSVSFAYAPYAHARGASQVLRDISFEVKACDSCAVIGPSGCGKTSLLFLLAGLLKPDSGTIDVSGQPRITTILQHYGLFPWKTVYQNIALGLQLQKKKQAHIASKVDLLLEDMGLSGFGNHFPGQLSGGMQQRVALARALAVEPDILLMDEPLSSLDALTREKLQNLILDVWQTKKITLLLVTHSIEEAVFLGRRIIVLSQRPGRLVNVVENPEAGDAGYRQSQGFFSRCNELRGNLGDEHESHQA